MIAQVIRLKCKARDLPTTLARDLRLSLNRTRAQVVLELPTDEQLADVHSDLNMLSDWYPQGWRPWA